MPRYWLFVRYAPWYRVLHPNFGSETTMTDVDEICARLRSERNHSIDAITPDYELELSFEEWRTNGFRTCSIIMIVYLLGRMEY
jgi:hypothetical protein